MSNSWAAAAGAAGAFFLGFQALANWYSGTDHTTILEASGIETSTARVARLREEMERVLRVQDQLARAQDLWQEHGTRGWRDMVALAEKYGVSTETLGDAFHQAQLGDQASEIARDFQAMIALGGDFNTVLAGFTDEIQHVVRQSMHFRTTIPESMRPFIAALIESRGLLDENGEVITDISTLQFAPDMPQAIMALNDVLSKLVDWLKIITQEARNASGAVTDLGVLDANGNPSTPWTGPRLTKPPMVADIPVSSVTSPGFAYVRPGDILGMPSLGGGGTSSTVIHIDARGAVLPDERSLERFAQKLLPRIAREVDRQRLR